jgi:hypothetical protein
MWWERDPAYLGRWFQSGRPVEKRALMAGQGLVNSAHVPQSTLDSGFRGLRTVVRARRLDRELVAAMEHFFERSCASSVRR